MRHYVFATQAEAQKAVDAINRRARQVYAAFGYQVDGAGAIIGKRGSDRADMPDACRTVTWDTPRQRLDGRWIVAHTETCPGAHEIADAKTGLLVWQYVGQDIAAPVEDYDAAWFPPPKRL